MYPFLIKTHRLNFLTLVLYCFFYSVFSAASVSILMPFINFIFTDATPSDYGFQFPHIPSDKGSWLIVLCAATWLIFLMKNLFYVAAQTRASRLKNDLTQNLREDYLKKLLDQPLSYFHATPPGYMTSRIFDVTRQLAEKLIGGLYDTARNIPLIVLYTVLLILISWKLMALSLILVPLISLAGHQLHKVLRKSITEEQSAWSRLVHYVQQKLYGIKLIKIFNSEDFERAAFHEQNTELKRVFLYRERMESIGISLVEMTGVSAGILLLYAIGTETLRGQFPFGPGGFVLFIAVVFSLIDPVKSLIRSVHSMKESEVLGHTLQQPVTLRQPEIESRAVIQRFERKVSLEEVSFCFESRSQPLFKNINLTIHKGEKIILTGKSGVGKSTLIDLLLGLYVPASGSITLDGISVDKIHKKSLSRIFGVVTQEAFIFHDTLRKNIAYNRSEISDDEIMEAVRRVQLLDWYDQLPHGLNTVIGDRGQTLSGGEKQRIVLARMILRDPDILVFDEATSALDIQAERALYETVFKLFADKTMILISHRHALYPFTGRNIEIKRGTLTEKTYLPTFT